MGSQSNTHLDFFFSVYKYWQASKDKTMNDTKKPKPSHITLTILIHYKHRTFFAAGASSLGGALIQR